jgi:hypothetical protein
VHALDLEGELSASLRDQVVVRLVKSGQGGQLGTREFGDGAEVESVNSDSNYIAQEEGQGYSGNERAGIRSLLEGIEIRRSS